MSWRDRDYAQEDGRPLAGRTTGFGANLTPVVRWLLVVNVAVALLRGVIHASGRGDPLMRWGCLDWSAAIWRFHWWRLVSYQYLHVGLLHLLFNMMMLWFLGPLVERAFSSRVRFLAFYTLCGVLAGVAFLAVVPLLSARPGGESLAGASGSILGLAAGAAMLFPRQAIYLFFAVRMQMRTFVLLLGGAYLLFAIAGGSLSDVAHLGGMAGGVAWVRVAALLGRRGEGRRIERSARAAGRWERRQRMLAREQERVDRILAKVHEKGIRSLTWFEKRALRKATERQRELDRQRP